MSQTPLEWFESRTWDHPDLREGEIYVCNVAPEDIPNIGWKNYRLGPNAYGQNRQPVDGLQAMFVSREEIAELDRLPGLLGSVWADWPKKPLIPYWAKLSVSATPSSLTEEEFRHTYSDRNDVEFDASWEDWHSNIKVWDKEEQWVQMNGVFSLQELRDLVKVMESKQDAKRP